MKTKKIRLLLLTIALIFMISAIPYFKPKDLTIESQKAIEDDLDHLQKTSDTVTLIDNHEDAFKVRMAMIQSAQETIDVSTYIIHEGKSTNQIFSELLKAADRGVKVRIVADGKLGGMNKVFGKALSNYPNIQVFTYNPFSVFKISSWQTVHHEKHITVDNTHLLMGGRNFGDNYFTPDTKTIKTVNDYDVFITGGEMATKMHDYYDSFITHEETRKVASKPNNKQTRLIEDLKTHQASNYDLKDYIIKTHAIEAITLMNNNLGVKDTSPKIAYALSYLSNQVKDLMILQTPYLSAHPHTLEKMRDTKARGVEVTLMTNSIASSPNFPAYSNYYKNKQKFIDTGINIYEYQSDGYHSQHGKAYIYDDLIALGSVNLDPRSFFINTESMVFIKSEGLMSELKSSIANKIDQSYHVAGDGINGGYDEPFEVAKSKEIIMYVTSIFSRLFSFLI